MEKKHKDLIQKLIEKTQEELLEWKKSSSKTQYRAELNSATFIVDKSIELTTFDDTYSLVMFHRDAQISIGYASPQNADDYKFLKDLYNAAEQSILKEDQTIKNVMDELDGLIALSF